MYSLDCLLSEYLLYVCFHWIAYCPSICYTCAFAGLLIVKVYVIPAHSLDCILSEHAYLCVRWMRIVPVSVITPVFSHKIPDYLLHMCIRVKKKRKKSLLLLLLDYLLYEYLLYLCIRWIAYCQRIYYSCLFAVLLIVRVSVTPVAYIQLEYLLSEYAIHPYIRWIAFFFLLLSICYTCVFAGLLTARMFVIPVLCLDCLCFVRVYVLPVYSLDCSSVVRA